MQKTANSAIHSEQSKVTMQIKEKQATLGVSNKALGDIIGCNENLVAMMLAGAMRVPASWIPKIAAALELNSESLLKECLRESDPVLLETIEMVFGPLTGRNAAMVA